MMIFISQSPDAPTTAMKFGPPGHKGIIQKVYRLQLCHLDCGRDGLIYCHG